MTTIDQVRTCIALLYSSGSSVDPQQRRSADHWLRDFQRQVEAWQVADALLQSDISAGTAAQAEIFFGAQTIHSKIRYDFEELPADSIPSLRDSLMAHLQRLKGAPQNIVTRLALSIAALALHIQWVELVPHSIAMVNSQPDTLRGFLELLTVVPEEANNYNLRVPDEKREPFRQHLYTVAPQVLQQLTLCMQMCGSRADMQGAVFACLKAWVVHCRIPPEVLATNPLLVACFDALKAPELFDEALEVLVEVIRVYPSSDANLNVVQLVVPRVMDLRPAYQQAVADEDEDAARGICRVFTEMAESYLSLLLGETEMNQATVVEMVLHCTGHPEIEIAEITLGFWYRFNLRLQRLGSDPNKPQEVAHRQRTLQKFTPHLSQLAQCTLRLMCFPAGFDTQPEDRKEDYRKLREDLGDVIDDCASLLGLRHVMDLVCAKLQQDLQTYQANLAGARGGQAAGWQGVEACLFAFKCIARHIPPDETAALPQIMGVLPRFTAATHPKLRYTATLLVGSCSKWVAQNHAAHLQTLFTFVTTGLSETDVSPASAQSIKRLCKYCGSYMGEAVLAGLTPVISADTCVMPLNSQLEVIEGLCLVVSQLPNYEAIVRCLNQLVSPVAGRLQQYASAAAGGAQGAQSAADVVKDLERLTAIIRATCPDGLPQGFEANPHPLVPMFQSLWPILQAVTGRFSTSATVAENVCRCYKHALRTGGAGMGVVLPELTKTLVERYTSTPHGPYLYAASICVTEFAEDPAYAPMLLHMTQALAARTFALLTSLENFTENPDVVEEFFYLFERLMQHNPQALVASQLLTPLTQCGLVGLTVQHREANRAVLNFFEKITDLGIRGTVRSTGSNKPVEGNPFEAPVRQLLLAEGLKLVQAVVAGVAGQLPSSRIDDDSGGSLAGVLWYLADFSMEGLKQWLHTTLSALPDEVVSAESKGKFVQQLEHWSMHRLFTEFAKAVREFSGQCRYRSRGRGSSKFHS